MPFKSFTLTLQCEEPLKKRNKKKKEQKETKSNTHIIYVQNKHMRRAETL